MGDLRDQSNKILRHPLIEIVLHVDGSDFHLVFTLASWHHGLSRASRFAAKEQIDQIQNA